MSKALLQSAKLLLNYRPQLALAALGLIISTVSFGSGLGMLLPTMHLLFNQNQNLHDLAQKWLLDPERPQVIQSLGQVLVPHLPQDQFRGFLLILIIIAVVTVIGSLGRFIHEYVTITVASRAAMTWRDQVYRHLIKVPILDSLQAGYINQINRLVNDTRAVADGLQTIIGRTLGEFLKLVMALVVAFCLDWRIAGFAVFGAPLLFWLMRKTGKRIQRASKGAMGERGRMTGALNEALSGLHVVKVHTAEGYERRRFRNIAKALFDQEMAMRAVKAYSSPLLDTLTLLGIMVIVSIAAWLILHDYVKQATFFSVLGCLAMAGSTVKPLTAFNINLHEASGSAERLAEMLQLPTEPAGGADGRPARELPRHHHEVVFDDVGFTYPGQDRAALSRVSLRAPFGQTIAIVGGNGSGKTTLMNLLTRLIEPPQGQVLIDGLDIREASLRSLRRQIAVVSQQSILFQGSIADNIAYGRRWEPMARIVAAAQAAFADEFVRELPRGYQTSLGEDGSGLSGGQRQRLCIARAILRDPSILILDEATSQIDADSEAKIDQALRQFRHGRTTFVIAHRLSTVVDADLIVVMDAGRIVDRGKHAELLERCPIYQTLTQTQLRGRRLPDALRQGRDLAPTGRGADNAAS